MASENSSSEVTVSSFQYGFIDLLFSFAASVYR